MAPIDDLLKLGAFLGIEFGVPVSVNPGLGFAFPAHHPFLEEMCDFYARQSFSNGNDSNSQGLVVPGTTQRLVQHGFVRENRYQEVAGISLYPSEYFDPMDNATGRIKTNSQHTHHSPLRQNMECTKASVYFALTSLAS